MPGTLHYTALDMSLHVATLYQSMTITLAPTTMPGTLHYTALDMSLHVATLYQSMTITLAPTTMPGTLHCTHYTTLHSTCLFTLSTELS